ncbi:MAG: peptide-methionine (R)-S-oxide reductase MsrB [Pseudomonadota bacterium]
MKKRNLLLLGLGGAAVFAGSRVFGTRDQTVEISQEKGPFEIAKSDVQWREQLTDTQYAVLRQEGTEQAFSSILNAEKRDGVYHCAGCDQELYRAEHKYDSRTGWPSFWQVIDGRVAYSVDYKLLYPRTEEHCSRCGGHLGHLFDDGPEPTGQRHCINGAALVFRPSDGSAPVFG